MKRLVLFLMVALLALPSLALAQTATFQAYGEVTAGYSVGCATVDAHIFSVDTRTKAVDCFANADRNCGLNACVYETSYSTTIGTLHQVSAIGSTNATMLGTASICGDPKTFSANTAFSQTNSAVSSATFNGNLAGCPGIEGYGYASSTQSFYAAPAR